MVILGLRGEVMKTHQEQKLHWDEATQSYKWHWETVADDEWTRTQIIGVTLVSIGISVVVFGVLFVLFCWIFGAL
jgi:hypothetical protein